MRTFATLAVLSLAAGSAAFAARPLQVEDLFKVKRVADPHTSVKGDIAYQVGSADPVESKVITHIWLKKAGEPAKELDLGPGNQSRPRFSPEGTRLSYQSGGQIWVVDLGTLERKQITQLPGGPSGQVWSPDGRYIAFTANTVPSGLAEENAAYFKVKAERKATGRHFTTLMYRHWDEYRDPNLFSHLFVVKADGSEAPRDLTPGLKQDVPNFAGTAAGDDYAWSPDSKTLAFGSHPEMEKADSTNGEIYEVALEGGPVKLLSGANKAMDCTPRYSPDGKFLAWRAQRRPGFEADRWELRLLERATGKITFSPASFDRPIGAFAWMGSTLVFAAEDKAQEPLFRWEPGKDPVRIVQRMHVDNFAPYAFGDKVLAQVSSTSNPPDLFDIDLSKGTPIRVTAHNQALTEELGLNPAEDLWCKGAPGKDGKAPQIQALVMKPVGFDPAKKYPVAVIIHGGPQGANADSWHFRWTMQAWAGRGFITVAPNPRGSTGFGQAFTDEISGDWGGKVITDLMLTLDATLKTYPNADPKKVVACGGSFGGFAVNWLAGHHANRFAAFVSHAGYFNTSSAQLATEEMWFPRWDFKGYPWESPVAKATWEKNSPHTGILGFKKPMLVTHGELDYRVVYTEALQLYNVHKLRGIPSELLVFPDENHFVLQPANSKLWFETVLGWCERWTK